MQSVLAPERSEHLLPQVLRLDANLTAVKRSNSSVYHYGVMGIWQMRGGACPAPASMMPLAGSCCEHPMSRAAQQLAKLSGLETYRAALSSTS